MSNKGYGKGTESCKFLRINSKDRVPSEASTDSKFTIDLGQNLQQIHQVSICSVSFNNVFYNVFGNSTTHNDGITLVVTGGTAAGTYTRFLDNGYYSVYTLMQKITNVLKSATSDAIAIEFTIDPISNKVTVELTAAPDGTTSVHLRAPTATESAGKPGRQTGWPIALLGGYPVTLTLNTPEQFVYMPNLNEPAIAYLLSSQMSPSNSFDEKGRFSNVLIAIPITAPFGGRNVFECKVDQLCEISYGTPRNLDRVDFELVDHNLDPLNLHGNSLNIELRVWLNRF